MKISAPFTWFGRVCLWLVFWPVGLWRSIHHGRKASERRMAKQLQGVAHPTDTTTPPRPEVG